MKLSVHLVKYIKWLHRKLELYEISWCFDSGLPFTKLICKGYLYIVIQRLLGSQSYSSTELEIFILADVGCLYMWYVVWLWVCKSNCDLMKVLSCLLKLKATDSMCGSREVEKNTQKIY